METAEGFGPYSEIAPAFGDEHSEHPSPELDGLKGFDPSWFFGFQSIEDFRAWFSPADVAALEIWNQGWLLSKYEVPHSEVWVGGGQVAFNLREATILGSFPISKLLADGGSSAIANEAVMESFFQLPSSQYPTYELVRVYRRYNYAVNENFGEEARFVLNNLQDGCHYTIDREHYRYVDGKLYMLVDGHSPDETEIDEAFLKKLATWKICSWNFEDGVFISAASDSSVMPSNYSGPIA